MFAAQVPVWAVLNYTNTESVARELLLCKISILGPDYFETQLARRYDWEPEPTEGSEDEEPHFDPNSPAAAVASRVREAASKSHPYAHIDAPHPEHLTPSQALASKHSHFANLEIIARQFGGKISDISNDCCIIELSASTKRIDSFLKLIRPYGILEMARSGASWPELFRASGRALHRLHGRAPWLG
jgi:acetolactate synthase-1/3 small subunit